MGILIQNCSEAQFFLVKNYIQEYELDDRVLLQEQFLTATLNEQLVAFGRVREYENFSELCSMGIITKERSKGFGKMMIQAMINKAKKQPYLACIMPDFFISFGFKITNDYPPEMQDKLNYCIGSLPVEEKYVVMTLKK